MVYLNGETSERQPWAHTIWRAWHLVLLKLPSVRRRVNLPHTCRVWYVFLWVLFDLARSWCHMMLHCKWWYESFDVLHSVTSMFMIAQLKSCTWFSSFVHLCGFHLLIIFLFTLGILGSHPWLSCRGVSSNDRAGELSSVFTLIYDISSYSNLRMPCICCSVRNCG